MNEKMLGLIDPEGYERVNRVYDTSGLSPTITARDYKDPVKILTGGIRKLGNVLDHDGGNYSGNVYDKHGIAPTIRTPTGGNLQPMIVAAAFRGRGDGWQHELELRKDDVANAITSVQKDSMVLDGSYDGYAIRKLTSREFFRLMGMTDDDYEKSASVVSETQRYKAAGNAICVSVLVAIFSQLNIQGIPMWNDMTIDERYRMIGR